MVMPSPEGRPDSSSAASSKSEAPHGDEHSGAWSFGDGDAHELLSLGKEMTSRAKFMVEAQETRFRLIQAKLMAIDGGRVEEMELPEYQAKREEALDWAASACSGNGAALSLAAAGSAAVAKKMMERQVRSTRFENQRQVLEDKQQKFTHSMLQKQESTSVRLQEHQKAANTERQRKLFTLNSSRQERQKMKRDIDRQEARRRGSMCAKNHHFGKDAKADPKSLAWTLNHSGPASVTGPALYTAPPMGREAVGVPQKAVGSRSSGSARGKHHGEPDAGEPDDIYRSSLQSHTVYNNTLDSWSQYVKENDIRSAQYWRKMVCNEGDVTGMLAESGKVRGLRAARPVDGESRLRSRHCLRGDEQGPAGFFRRSHQRHGGSPAKAPRSAQSPQQEGATKHGVLPKLLHSGTGVQQPSILGSRSAPLLGARLAAPGPGTRSTPLPRVSRSDSKASLLPKTDELPSVMRDNRSPRRVSALSSTSSTFRPGSRGLLQSPSVSQESWRASKDPSRRSGSKDSPRPHEARLLPEMDQGAASHGRSSSKSVLDLPPTIRLSKDENEIHALRSHFFKNDHRIALRVSDLIKMRQYAAAISPQDEADFSRTV